MRYALLALAFVLPLSAAAQDPIDPLDFWPMEAGNVWEYAVHARGSGGGPEVNEWDGYERWTVVREMTPGTYGLNVVRSYSETPPSGDPTVITCEMTIWRDDDMGIYIEIDHTGTPTARCPDLPYAYYGNTPVVGHATMDPEPPSGPVVVGGVAYEVEAMASGRYYDSSPTNTTVLHDWTHALGIGITEMVYDWTGMQNAFNDKDFTLVYALVGGRVYGTSPVANEPPPDGTSETPAAFRVESAYPNPFQDGVTMAFSLPTSDAVVLSLYDVRGRQVAARDLGALPAGSHRAVLDGADLAPGLYLARLTTGSGQQASHRLVRAD